MTEMEKNTQDPNNRKKRFAIELEYLLFILGYLIVFLYSSWQITAGLLLIILAENLHVIRMVFSGKKDFWKEIWKRKNDKKSDEK